MLALVRLSRFGDSGLDRNRPQWTPLLLSSRGLPDSAYHRNGHSLGIILIRSFLDQSILGLPFSLHLVITHELAKRGVANVPVQVSSTRHSLRSCSRQCPLDGARIVSLMRYQYVTSDTYDTCDEW